MIGWYTIAGIYTSIHNIHYFVVPVPFHEDLSLEFCLENTRGDVAKERGGEM